jgi:hypothetical protein
LLLQLALFELLFVLAFRLPCLVALNEGADDVCDIATLP